MFWKIDPSRTEIGFSVKHMMISTVHGRFTKFDGRLALDDEHPERSWIDGWVETASITTDDPGRDRHLRSPDFIDAEQFPRMTFRARKITHIGGERFRLTGEMTIRKITREITFEVRLRSAGSHRNRSRSTDRVFTADSSLSRKDYGLTWNVALETGGWLVSDQVKIHIELALIAAPDA
jgi:polyisoprenoid-binding protein YceI